MASEPAERPDAQWLLSPPGPGEVQIHLAVGEGTQLTPEIRQALERLVSALHGQDVTGYAWANSCYPKCPDLAGCERVYCGSLHNCRPLDKAPCVANVSCKIAELGRL
jgi:hypothetical protein